MTEESKNEKFLRDQWKISQKISLIEQNDGFHLKGTDGVDYGIIMGNTLMAYNPELEYPPTDEGVIPKYDVKEVSSVRLSPDDFYFIVQTIDPVGGQEVTHTHLGKVGRPANLSIIPDTSNKSLDVVIDMIRRYYPAWKECICCEKFSKEPLINRLLIGEEPKWESASGEKTYVILEMTRYLGTKDNKDYYEANGQKYSKIKLKPADVYQAVLWMAWRNPRDRFMDRISRVEWDGVSRIDDFYKGLGGTTMLPPAQNDEYLSMVGRATFLAPLQRHLQKTPVSIPFIPLFIGEQHVGKTDICKMIGLVDWHVDYSEQTRTLEDLYYATQGNVIVELAEAVAVKKAGPEAMKALADASKAQFRTKYDAFSSTKPLGSTFIITTNDDSLLTDDTGNRRYFPIVFNPEKAKRTTMSYGMDPFDPHPTPEVYQLWAEALDMYECRHLRWASGMLIKGGRGFKPIYTAVQKQAVYNEPWENCLMEWLDEHYPNMGDIVTNKEIRQFLITYDAKSESGNKLGLNSAQVDAIMRRLGHSTKKFDLEKLKCVAKRDGTTVSKYIEYRRTRDAVFDSDTRPSLVTARSTLDGFQEDPLDMHYGL